MPSARRDAISAIGITVIENGEITDNYYTLVDPECDFDDYTIALTGITPEMAGQYPNFAALWEDIRPYLDNAVLAAHGAQGDLHVLSRTLRRYGIKWQESVRYICTFEAAKKCFPELPGYSLNKISDALGIPLQHHVASSDSYAAAMILLKCAGVSPDILTETKVYSIKAAYSVTDALSKKRTVTDIIQKEIGNFVTKKFSVTQKKALTGKTRYKVLGVKPSTLKKYSQRVLLRSDFKEFLENLPHTYYEENLVHAYVLNRLKNFELCISSVSVFLPFIDDDAVFFALNPKVLQQDKNALFKKCGRWFYSPETYARAFAVRMYSLAFTGEEDFSEELSEKIAGVYEENGAVFLCAADYFFRLMKFGGVKAQKYVLKASGRSKAASRGIEFYNSDVKNNQSSPEEQN